MTNTQTHTLTGHPVFDSPTNVMALRVLNFADGLMYEEWVESGSDDSGSGPGHEDEGTKKQNERDARRARRIAIFGDGVEHSDSESDNGSGVDCKQLLLQSSSTELDCHS